MAITNDYKNLLAELQARSAPAPAPSAQDMQAWQATQQGPQQPVDAATLIAQTKQLASSSGQRKIAQATQSLQETPVEAPVADLSGQSNQEFINTLNDQELMRPENVVPAPEKLEVQQAPKVAIPLETAPIAPVAPSVVPAVAPAPAAPGLQGYASGMDDAALVAAMDEQRQLQKNAMFARAMGHFGNSAVLSAGGTVRDNNAGYDAMDAYAKGATDKVLARRKGASEEEGLKQSKAKTFADADEMQQNDPNSPVSKAAQEFAVKLGLNPEAVKKSSYANIQKLMTEKRLNDQFNESVKARLQTAGLAKSAANDIKKAELDLKTKKFQTPSDKQVTAITSLDDTLGAIESIKRQKGDYDTGPVSAFQSWSAQLVGMDDAEKSAFKAQVGDQLAQYMKDISGAAVSDKERARLSQNLPKMSDNDETFASKLQVVEDRLKMHRRNALINMKKQGKDITEYQDVDTNKQAAKSAIPKGHIDNGHRFKGGDPNKEENWELVK
jgi:hypothetical protein